MTNVEIQELIQEKQYRLDDIRETLYVCNNIIIGTDRDSEGEFMGYKLSEKLGLVNPKRVTFSALTSTIICNSLFYQTDGFTAGFI
jgi:DNA topoisomerase IA